ncbi:MAG: methyl-accepting chemotaxis protein [Clostridia bacterium]|nr:methyl-accepting chemotaxis protein [Clostridia bacterium]
METVLIQIISTIFIVMLILCIALSFILSNIFTKTTEKELNKISTINANTTKEYIMTMQTFSTAIANEVARYRTLDTQTADQLIRNCLEGVLKDEKIFSAYFAFEPNKYFPETPDGLSYYVYRDGSNTGIDVFNDYASYSTGDYYATSKKLMAPHITEPYSWELTTGETVWLISLSSPIIDENGVFLGVANCDILLDTLKNLNFETGGYKTSSSCILTEEGNYIADSSTPENVGTAYKATTESEKEILAAAKNKTSVIVKDVDKTNGNAKNWIIQTPIKIDGIEKTWSSAFKVDKSEAFSSVYDTILIVSLIAFAGIIILAIFCYTNLKKSLSPINGLVVKVQALGEGKLSTEKSASYSNDEIGRLSEIYENTSVTLNSYIGEISEILTQISSGNLNLSVDRDYIGDFDTIKNNLNEIILSLNSMFSEMNISAEQVYEGAMQVSSAAQSLSQGATEQASSVEELSSTVSEITTHIKQTAENAEKAKQISIDANVATNQSQQQMEKMIAAMNEINNTSNEIGKIIKNIDDIAFQTNILALNAAVEAARAGSAGKGFAVVAEEVRNLAGKSAESAKITATLIESSLTAINKGSKIVADTAKSLEDVVIGSKNSAEVIQSIADASAEQAHSVEQVNIGIEQISNVVQTNSATAEESAAASEELSGQAQMLKELINNFKLKDTAQTSATSESYSNSSSSSSSYSENFNNKNSKFKSNTTFIDL